MSLTREILSPVTTAGLLYPALNRQIAQIAMPNMVARQFFQPFALTAGNAVTFPKQVGSAGAVINEVSEGAEIVLDVTPYSSVVAVPKKIGHGFLITIETIEDSLLPIQQDQLVRSTLRVANKIDLDCIATIVAGVQSGNTVAATGKSQYFDGSEKVISGSGGPALGTYDIIDAKAKIEQYNYIPDTLLVHPQLKKWIEKLPHFTTSLYYGESMLAEGLIQLPGKFGEILGLDAFSSTNAPSGSAIVLSRGRTANILGQYSPMGFFVERRPMTGIIKPLPERDAVGVFITARYVPVVLKGETIALVTGSAW